MNIWQAIVLGAVQGFTEFLPVSSSGHLILLQKLFGIKDNILFYSVMLHLGTLIPVLIVLKDEIKGLFTKPFSLLFCLILATIPAGIMGLTINHFVSLDEIFMSCPYLLGVAFLITAVLLFLSDRQKKEKLNKEITPLTAVCMGLGQMIGVVPGISRSGICMSSGNFVGVKKERNATFTFLMSIPIILSAVILEGGKCISSGKIANVEILPVIFGVLSSCICGYIAINFMMKLIKKAQLKWFSIYLIFLSFITFFI